MKISSINDQIYRDFLRVLQYPYRARLNTEIGYNQCKNYSTVAKCGYRESSAPIYRLLIQLIRLAQNKYLMPWAISGEYDLIAKLTGETTQALDKSIGFIRQINGVEKNP